MNWARYLLLSTRTNFERNEGKLCAYGVGSYFFAFLVYFLIKQINFHHELLIKVSIWEIKRSYVCCGLILTNVLKVSRSYVCRCLPAISRSTYFFHLRRKFLESSWKVQKLKRFDFTIIKQTSKYLVLISIICMP